MGSCRIYAPLLVLSLALAPSLSSAFAPITANTLRIMSRRAASAALSPPNVKRIRGGGAHALNMATLYCKQGEKEGSMGECPFTLKANMALRSKKVDFESVMINFAAKPEWFMKLNEKGTAPTFTTDQGKTITDSEDIISWLDETVPEGGLLKGNSDAAAVWDAGSGVFPALGKLLKNTEVGDEPELKTSLKAELQKLEDALAKRPVGGLLGGKRLVHEDCRLAPFLFHVSATVPAFKGEDVLASLPATTAYLAALSATPEFQAATCPPEGVVFGWKSKVGIKP